MKRSIGAGLAGALAFEAAMLIPSGADAMTRPGGDAVNVCTTARAYVDRSDGGFDLKVQVPMAADLSEGLGETLSAGGQESLESAEFALVMDGLSPIAWGRVQNGKVEMPAGQGVVTLIAAAGDSACSVQIML